MERYTDWTAYLSHYNLKRTYRRIAFTRELIERSKERINASLELLNQKLPIVRPEPLDEQGRLDPRCPGSK
jgi:hypothetical protein